MIVASAVSQDKPLKGGSGMSREGSRLELLNLLNQAMARELQVSIQYMLQHSVGAGQASVASGGTPMVKLSKFIGSHASVWLPGASLKKIAIAEMRHAEAIAERITALGGKVTTEPAAVTIGTGAKEMLEDDREQERLAIELYRQIIELAGRERDDVTMKLFQGILSDEEKHHRVFTNLLSKV